MTQSLPSFSGTQGSSAIAAVLESIREELLPELDALRNLFQQEVSPRAKRIGELLSRAQGNFSRNLDFYDWADTAVGLKQRQIRSYIRFAQRLAAIEAAAEDQRVPISSIEQGLALLAPSKEEDQRTDEEVRVAAVAQATGRALGSLNRAMDAIYDLSPGGLSPDEIDLFQRLGDVLTRWGSTTKTPSPAITALASVADRHIDSTTNLAVNRQQEEPVEPLPTATADEMYDWIEDGMKPQAVEAVEQVSPPVESNASDNPKRQYLIDKGLDVDAKPSKWSLGDLEFGLSLCDDNGATLAKAIGVSRASISGQLKKKREAAGLIND